MVLLFKAVTDVGGQTVTGSQGVLQPGEVTGKCLPVGGGESGIAAGQRLAVGHGGLIGAIGGRAAQGAVRVVDAGDESAWVQVGVVAGQDAAQACFVGDDLAVEDSVAGELGQPGFGFRSGGPCQRRPGVVGA
ncbi:hypothetical protein ACQPXT_39920 [Streptomyces sp. CA-100214]